MYRLVRVAAADGIQVAEDTVGDERCERCREHRNGLQAGVERLVGRQFVVVHTAAPETLAVQAHVPVREVFSHELLDGACRRGRVVILERAGYFLDERIEQRNDPAVDLRALFDGNFRLLARKSVHIGVEREERVGVIERPEELAAYFVHAVPVEFEVVPRLRVGDHIPARGVGPVGCENLERVDAVAQALRHLVAVFVQHQPVRNNVFKGYRVEEHRGDGMQREEPAARLVDALGDEIGRVDRLEIVAAVLERIVQLRVRHGTRVEPHVDQVAFALHRLAFRRHEYDIVHIGAVQVDIAGRVVLLRHVADLEILVGVLLHEARGDRLFDLIHQLPDRTDALQFRIILRSPYRQRCAPEARARKVPVHQPFEPFAETACPGRFGFPSDRLVQLDHPLAQRRGADEPRIERVVEHRLVRTPAVGVGVGMLFDLECLVLGFQHHGQVDVERCLDIAGDLRVVGVLDVAARILLVFFDVDVVFYEFRVEVFEYEELALLVDHRLVFAGFVDHEQRGDACGLGHTVVVGAERRCDVHDARTVRCGHVVAHDHAERVARRLYPGDQLLVTDPLQFGPHPAFARDLVASLNLLGEVRCDEVLGEDDRLGFVGIGVAAFDLHVFDRGAYGQRGVRRQGPRRGRPRQEIERPFGVAEELFAFRVADDPELRRARRVLHVAVAARLVQLVRRKPRARSRRVGLDRIALIEQPLVEKLFEQPPQGLDVFVVVGDVRIVHVDPVPHLAGQVFPCPRELHDGLAAGAVVLLDRNLPADVFLGDAELLFDAQLHGKPVRVPARLAVHEIPLLCLVAAKDVLDRAGHDMVDAGHPVGRRGAFVEYERGVPLARGDALVECVAGVPFAEHVGGYLGQVEAFILIEFHGICVFYFVRGRTPAWPEVPERFLFFRQLAKI